MPAKTGTLGSFLKAQLNRIPQHKYTLSSHQCQEPGFADQACLSRFQQPQSQPQAENDLNGGRGYPQICLVGMHSRIASPKAAMTLEAEASAIISRPLMPPEATCTGEEWLQDSRHFTLGSACRHRWRLVDVVTPQVQRWSMMTDGSSLPRWSEDPSPFRPLMEPGAT